VTIFLTLVGVALILIALRDIFQQLFQPSGRGSLSRMIMRAVWSGFRRVAHRNPQLLARAGPTVLLAIIGSWVTLTAVGWTLIIWPRMPGEFLFSAGLDPSKNDGFIAAVPLAGNFGHPGLRGHSADQRLAAHPPAARSPYWIRHRHR